MTLLLLFAQQDEITVLADTLFGTPGDKAAEIGPKIFTVPITVSDLNDARKEMLPNMGFAFAGNTLSGQFTHALASTCLQNLAALTAKQKPDVKDVARYYGNCAKLIYEERRRHQAHDSFGFEGVVFGYSASAATAQAFYLRASVTPDGDVEAPVHLLQLTPGIPYPIGSGAPVARDAIASLVLRGNTIDPYEFMDWMIWNKAAPTVGGEFQAATAGKAGVELRPVMRLFRSKSGDVDVDFSIMGINIHRVGMIAGCVPVGTPLPVDCMNKPSLTFGEAASDPNHTVS